MFNWINQMELSVTLPLEMRSVMCVGAEENQAHRCDPYGLRVQEQPLCWFQVGFPLLWIKAYPGISLLHGS